jgi:hypothetical protein
MRVRGLITGTLIVVLATIATFSSAATASARVVMGCSHFGRGRIVLSRVKAHPSDCGNGALGGTSAGIYGASWRNWGAPVSAGRGQLVDGLGFRYQAHFWVFGRSRRDGATFYTRMHLISVGAYRGDAWRPGLNRTVSITPYGLTKRSALAASVIRVYRYAGVIQGLSVQPRSVTLAADGNDTITGLRWRGWGAPTTRASGINHFNDCNPSCANGRIIRIQTTLTLSNRGYYRGHYVYKCYAIKPLINGFGRICLP